MSAGAASALLHLPVLKNEVLTALNPKAGEVFVDGTFGAGGYSRALLEAAECKVFGLDRDPQAVALSLQMAQEFGDRLEVKCSRFSQMESALLDSDVSAVNGVALDVGVSSMQIDQSERGFSFSNDGPLDMRMGGAGQTAADFVNTVSEKELADVIWRYGEEPASRRIAKALVNERQTRPFERTSELAAAVSRAIGGRGGPRKRHPATRVFQALRIFINDELNELQLGLEAAERLLVEGGRLCVVTFHSLEDRIVKRFFQERRGGEARVSRHIPEQVASKDAPQPTFALKERKAIRPGTEEIESNPRSRSARMRWGFRTAASAWTVAGPPGDLGEAI